MIWFIIVEDIEDIEDIDGMVIIENIRFQVLDVGIID